MNYIQYLTGLDPEAKDGKTLQKPGWWSLFASMKFAIWVLIALGVLSVVSLFVGELADPKIIDSTPKDAVGAAGRLLYVLFDMADPFRSWWYRLLIGGLCLSLFACVWERTPIVWKIWKRPPQGDTSWLKDIHTAIVRDVNVDTQALRTRMGVFYDWRLKSDDIWVGERGRWGLWGPLATHFGMLLICVGGLVTSFGSFTTRDGGYAGDIVTVENMPFEVRVDSFRIQYYPLQVGQLVLAEGEWLGKIVSQNSDSSWTVQRRLSETESQKVSLWDYDLTNHWDYNRDRGNISKFISYVTLMEDSQEVDSREISVNSPLRRAGFRLYQSSYDAENPKVRADYDSIIVTVSDTLGNLVTRLSLRPGETKAVAGDTLRIVAGELLPNFKMDSKFAAYSASADFVNPAVQLGFKGQSGYDKVGWSFINQSGHNRIVGAREYKIEALHGERATQELATIFEIKRTFGTEFLWLGFFVCTIGLILSFYVTHRVVYVEWPSAADAPTRVIGLTKKTVALYSNELDRLLHSVEATGRSEHLQPAVS